MSGAFKGVQARILSLNERALYFHCVSHRLNLCIVKSRKVPMVKNRLAAVASFAAFFIFAPKRQRKLEKVIQTVYGYMQSKMGGAA
ncbi:52 kda repressor of the inhibitor of the protein kinase [Plakobranchus ocellatus]|uniref:52 kDa repressor of the inhibitor of the protein kinase n=1 Tax=Plakobranchus ocellatus TaxID=259542 RepID=A0AAV4DFZ3_9GAST|nr:52 kda repressor of the inhibitor of the protein kinase [Plakobranchus ocellatus]